jgi:hypothetical protein
MGMGMTLEQLIERSEELDNALRQVMTDTPIPDETREQVAHALGLLSMEHGHGIRTLFRGDNPAPAMALLRPQFECLVRMNWVRWCASEKWMEDFSGDVDEDAPKEPEEFPRMYQMLGAFEGHEKKKIIGEAFTALKLQGWDALNSYTHGGLRAVRRALNGFEAELIDEVIRTSNGLVFIAALHIAEGCRADELILRLHTAAANFNDCFAAPLPGATSIES